MRDFFQVFGWLILGAILFIAGSGFLSAWGGSVECASKWDKSGFQHDYGFIKGCMISKDGKHWIPSGNYRDIAD